MQMTPSSSGFMESRTCNPSTHTSTRCPPTLTQLRRKKRRDLHSWMSWWHQPRLAIYSLWCTGNKPMDQCIPYHSQHHSRMLTGVMRGMRTTPVIMSPTAVLSTSVYSTSVNSWKRPLRPNCSVYWLICHGNCSLSLEADSECGNEPLQWYSVCTCIYTAPLVLYHY